MKTIFSAIMSRLSVVSTYSFAGVSFANLPAANEVKEFQILNGVTLRITGIRKDAYKCEQLKGA